MRPAAPDLRERRAVLRQGDGAVPGPDMPGAPASAVRGHTRQAGDAPGSSRHRVPVPAGRPTPDPSRVRTGRSTTPSGASTCSSPAISAYPADDQTLVPRARRGRRLRVSRPRAATSSTASRTRRSSAWRNDRAEPARGDECGGRRGEPERPRRDPGQRAAVAFARAATRAIDVAAAAAGSGSSPGFGGGTS